MDDRRDLYRAGGDPYFSPGEGWHYSPAGYQIATLIVEQVTGSTVAEEVRARLLGPLDIQDMILDLSRPLPAGVTIWGHALFSGQVLEPDSLNQMLTFVRPEDYGTEPPIFSGYGLGVLAWIPEILHGEYGYGHSGSIPGYRAFLAHLPERGLTIAVMSNCDKEEELAGVIDALLAVALDTAAPAESAGLSLELAPADRPPAGATVVHLRPAPV